MSIARGPVAASVLFAAVPLAGFVVYASLRSTLRYPLPDHQWKILVLSLIGAAVALLGVAELALVKVALQNEPAVVAYTKVQSSYPRFETEQPASVESGLAGIRARMTRASARHS